MSVAASLRAPLEPPATLLSRLQGLAPERVSELWPAGTPLALLGSFVNPTQVPSAGAAADRWSRWSIAGAPAAWHTLTAADLPPSAGKDSNTARVRDFLLAHLPGRRPSEQSPADAGETVQSVAPRAPFSVFVLAYELGRVLEPAPTPREHREPPAMAPHTPLIAACRLDSAFLHDRLANRWSIAGTDQSGSETNDLVAHLASGLAGALRDPLACAADAGFTLSPLGSTSAPLFDTPRARDEYQAAVRQATRLILDGDLFQVNLAHHLTARFRGSHRVLFSRLARSARPWFGALLELPAPWPTVLSASPELLLEYQPATRVLTTRPIKGTRPRSADPRDLLASTKDRAELNMITDLMRNDLGRVATPGSVRVETPAAIETHRVHHTVSTVSATLRDGLSSIDALLACFPGGSVTGAPKVRAMQVIEDLERHPRGVYCGCIVLADASGRLVANIAIRTISLQPGRTAPDSPGAEPDAERVLSYPVGAGIVADSDPAGEYAETLAKADALVQLLTPA